MAGPIIVYDGAAQAAALEAKRIACRSIVNGYEDRTASIEQRQQYATCVDLLYPTALPPGAALFLKVWIVCALLAAPLGAWMLRHEDPSGGAEPIIFGAVLGPIAVGAVGLALIGIAAGIGYVLS